MVFTHSHSAKMNSKSARRADSEIVEIHRLQMDLHFKIAIMTGRSISSRIDDCLMELDR